MPEMFPPRVTELKSEDLGIELTLALDSDLYEQEDAEEITETLAKVITTWWKRRSFMNNHPEFYGYKVN